MISYASRRRAGLPGHSRVVQLCETGVLVALKKADKALGLPVGQDQFREIAETDNVQDQQA
jgi:hypothetical protein